MVNMIDGNLGELSAFHGTFGFYVHGVPIDTAVLPTGWEERAIEVRNENTRNYTGWCVFAEFWKPALAWKNLLLRLPKALRTA